MPDYYGKYEGIVYDNNDPKQKGRIKLKIPEILGDEISNWAKPCFPYAGDDVGSLFIPEEGDLVWTEFQAGDVNRPIWVGGTLANPDGESEAPDKFKEDSPDAKTIKTSEGHKIVLIDAEEDPRIIFEHSSGSKEVYYNEDGIKGHKLEDIKGDSTTQTAGNISLDAGANLDMLSSIMMNIQSDGPMSISTSEMYQAPITIEGGGYIDVSSNMYTEIESGGYMNLVSNMYTSMSSGYITIDSDAYTEISSSGYISLSSESYTNISSELIRIGSESASKNVVCGPNLVDTLVKLIDGILSITVTTESGPKPINNQPTFETIKTELQNNTNNVLSTKVFTE